MYISGTYDTRWNNDVLNPAFSGLTASDFEVIQLGWAPTVAPVVDILPSTGAGRAADTNVTAYDVNGNVATGYRGTIQFTSTDGAATLPVPYTFTAADAGTHRFPASVTMRTLGPQHVTVTDTATPTITGSRRTNVISTLSAVVTTTHWACFQYTTRSAADAEVLGRNYDATLVSTGYADYPYVVIERWICGSCGQSPAPLFTAEPCPPGTIPAPNERLATGTDGTLLLVRRPSGTTSSAVPKSHRVH